MHLYSSRGVSEVQKAAIGDMLQGHFCAKVQTCKCVNQEFHNGGDLEEILSRRKVFYRFSMNRLHSALQGGSLGSLSPPLCL